MIYGSQPASVVRKRVAASTMSPHINSKVVSTNCRGVASQHHGSSRLECTNNSSQQLFISFFFSLRNYAFSALTLSVGQQEGHCTYSLTMTGLELCISQRSRLCQHCHLRVQILTIITSIVKQLLGRRKHNEYTNAHHTVKNGRFINYNIFLY